MSRHSIAERILAGLPLPLRAHRLAYRLAFSAMKAWWLLRRPRQHGACILIHDDRQVLVLRTSYRRGYTLPGGGIEKGETPREAALREAREEVGIVVARELLRDAGTLEARESGRLITTFMFEWQPAILPEPRADGREIVWAGYLGFEELAGERMTPGLAQFVARRLAGATIGGSRPKPIRGKDHALLQG